MKQVMEYAPEQIADAEKLCQRMQGIPAERRQLYTYTLLAYMNGVEAGIALEKDAQARPQTTAV